MALASRSWQACLRTTLGARSRGYNLGLARRHTWRGFSRHAGTRLAICRRPPAQCRLRHAEEPHPLQPLTGSPKTSLLNGGESPSIKAQQLIVFGSLSNPFADRISVAD